MSRILKRPMFRKGGEVMEGIMTGIKPRKMYALGPTDQGVVDNVRRKMSLIDAIAGGGSPLSDPLTQFLLTAGPDLVAGKAAGGTKLQEILGGIKPGLDRAIKTQQLKDLSNRKLATSLIAKSKIGGAEQAWKDYGQYSGMSKSDFIREFAQKELFKKKTNPEDRKIQAKRDITEDLGKYKDFLRNPEYNPVQKKRIVNAIDNINANEKLEQQLDSSKPFVGLGEYSEIAPIAMKDSKGKEKKLRVFEPDDKDDFRLNKLYFLFDENIYVRYDPAKNRLVEDPNY